MSIFDKYHYLLCVKKFNLNIIIVLVYILNILLQ